MTKIEIKCFKNNIFGCYLEPLIEAVMVWTQDVKFLRSDVS